MRINPSIGRDSKQKKKERGKMVEEGETKILEGVQYILRKGETGG